MVKQARRDHLFSPIILVFYVKASFVYYFGHFRCARNALTFHTSINSYLHIFWMHFMCIPLLYRLISYFTKKNKVARVNHIHPSSNIVAISFSFHFNSFIINIILALPFFFLVLYLCLVTSIYVIICVHFLM